MKNTVKILTCLVFLIRKILCWCMLVFSIFFFFTKNECFWWFFYYIFIALVFLSLFPLLFGSAIKCFCIVKCRASLLYCISCGILATQNVLYFSRSTTTTTTTTTKEHLSFPDWISFLWRTNFLYSNKKQKINPSDRPGHYRNNPRT